MPTATKYTYDSATDFSNGVNLAELVTEIGVSSIVTAVDTVLTKLVGTVLDFWFKDVLSTADKTTLDGGLTQAEESPPLGGSVLADHAGTASPADAPTVVMLEELNTSTVDSVTSRLDLGTRTNVSWRIKDLTGAHAVHVVQLQASLTDSAVAGDWFDISGETITGLGGRLNVNVSVRYVRAKVTTIEGLGSTVEVAIQAK